MTYLDTHAVVWLYEGTATRFGKAALHAIRHDNLLVSPAVILELQLLHEIRRLTQGGDAIVDAVSELGVQVCHLGFRSVVDSSLDLKWVRDPFDRLIVAHARANDAALITKDENIRRHYKRAIW